MRTFEACSLAEGMDLGGGQSGPGDVGWGKGEAVGRVEGQRGGRRAGHGMFETNGCLDISPGEGRSAVGWRHYGSGGSWWTCPSAFRARAGLTPKVLLA